MLHRTVGLLVLLLFLGTGLWMRLSFPDAYHGDPVVRLLFRANHVYLLLSALLNLAIGAYMTSQRKGWVRKLQFAGSAFLLLAPVVLAAAFWSEPATGTLERPFTVAGIVLLALGTLSHMWASRRG